MYKKTAEVLTMFVDTQDGQNRYTLRILKETFSLGKFPPLLMIDW